MAECLEDTSGKDTDRVIDSCGFLKEQFDIFKHDYREAFDEHGHEKLANLTLDNDMKKEVVNTLRKLQKAKHNIESYNLQGEDRANVADLLQKIGVVLEELERVIRGKVEFSIQNVHLPEYDTEAIAMLFGSQDENSVDKKAIDDLRDFNRIFEEKVSGVLGAATLLLSDYANLEEFMKENA
uniref:Uncharacterized protein n=1 Tax=Panagrolaimus davidi TaxID=227884 RepID=A0A914NY28_9BILA